MAWRPPGAKPLHGTVMTKTNVWHHMASHGNNDLPESKLCPSVLNLCLTHTGSVALRWDIRAQVVGGGLMLMCISNSSGVPFSWPNMENETKICFSYTDTTIAYPTNSILDLLWLILHFLICSRDEGWQIKYQETKTVLTRTVPCHYGMARFGSIPSLFPDYDMCLIHFLKVSLLIMAWDTLSKLHDETGGILYNILFKMNSR